MSVIVVVFLLVGVLAFGFYTGVLKVGADQIYKMYSGGNSNNANKVGISSSKDILNSGNLKIGNKVPGFEFGFLAQNDTDGDGTMDEMYFDEDGDGVIEKKIEDTNNDNIMGNGGDTIWLDSDKNGQFDVKVTEIGPSIMDGNIFLDTNGDGKLDKVVWDNNGDGVIDATGNLDPNTGEPMDMTWDKNGDGVGDITLTDKDNDEKPEIGGIEYDRLDIDEDGVFDDVDQCWFEEGPVGNNGCPYPDTDGDGITDNIDPDIDGDGISNSEDTAPTIPGQCRPTFQGTPGEYRCYQQAMRMQREQEAKQQAEQRKYQETLQKASKLVPPTGTRF